MKEPLYSAVEARNMGEYMAEWGLPPYEWEDFFELYECSLSFWKTYRRAYAMSCRKNAKD